MKPSFEVFSKARRFERKLVEASFHESYYRYSLMSVWMGASMKASMNFTRKQLPGFRCFRRICRSHLLPHIWRKRVPIFCSRKLPWTPPWKSWLSYNIFIAILKGGRFFNRRFRNPPSLAYAHGGSTRNFTNALPCYQVPNTHTRLEAHVLPRQLSYRLYCMYCSPNRPSAVGRRRACSPRSYGS